MTGQSALAASYDSLLLDLDGVVYIGPQAVPHAAQALAAARAAGVGCAFVTNNASRTPDLVAEHLNELGIPATAREVVNSSQAAAHLILEQLGTGATVLAVGGPGVTAALLDRGLVPVETAEPTPQAVMMGYGPDVGWRNLAEAAYAVHAGALFVATNPDTSFPTPRGIAPGNGTLVAAVSAATGVKPIVAGKPFAPIVREAIDRLGAHKPLMVGDRLDTDIEAAYNTQIDSLLVMTGVTTVRELCLAPIQHRPTFVSPDLRGLAHPADALRVRTDASGSPWGQWLRGIADAWKRNDEGSDPCAGVDLERLEKVLAEYLAA
jgi:HAD superfamily hydrolase (TIGR01457 family)